MIVKRLTGIRFVELKRLAGLEISQTIDLYYYRSNKVCVYSAIISRVLLSKYSRLLSVRLQLTYLTKQKKVHILLTADVSDGLAGSTGNDCQKEKNIFVISGIFSTQYAIIEECDSKRHFFLAIPVFTPKLTFGAVRYPNIWAMIYFRTEAASARMSALRSFTFEATLKLLLSTLKRYPPKMSGEQGPTRVQQI